MSQTRGKIWKAIAPLAGARDPVIDTGARRHAAWARHYFAIFVAMIVGMILEPIPATAISFIAVTVSVLSANWVLFGAQELAEPGFKAGKEALKWGWRASPAPPSGWCSAPLSSRWATRPPGWGGASRCSR